MEQESVARNEETIGIANSHHGDNDDDKARMIRTSPTKDEPKGDSIIQDGTELANASAAGLYTEEEEEDEHDDEPIPYLGVIYLSPSTSVRNDRNKSHAVSSLAANNIQNHDDLQDEDDDDDEEEPIPYLGMVYLKVDHSKNDDDDDDDDDRYYNMAVDELGSAVFAKTIIIMASSSSSMPPLPVDMDVLQTPSDHVEHEGVGVRVRVQDSNVESTTTTSTTTRNTNNSNTKYVVVETVSIGSVNYTTLSVAATRAAPTPNSRQVVVANNTTNNNKNDTITSTSTTTSCTSHRRSVVVDELAVGLALTSENYAAMVDDSMHYESSKHVNIEQQQPPHSTMMTVSKSLPHVVSSNEQFVEERWLQLAIKAPVIGGGGAGGLDLSNDDNQLHDDSKDAKVASHHTSVKDDDNNKNDDDDAVAVRALSEEPQVGLVVVRTPYDKTVTESDRATFNNTTWAEANVSSKTNSVHLEELAVQLSLLTSPSFSGANMVDDSTTPSSRSNTLIQNQLDHRQHVDSFQKVPNIMVTLPLSPSDDKWHVLVEERQTQLALVSPLTPDTPSTANVNSANDATKTVAVNPNVVVVDPVSPAEGAIQQRRLDDITVKPATNESTDARRQLPNDHVESLILDNNNSTPRLNMEHVCVDELGTLLSLTNPNGDSVDDSNHYKALFRKGHDDDDLSNDVVKEYLLSTPTPATTPALSSLLSSAYLCDGWYLDERVLQLAIQSNTSLELAMVDHSSPLVNNSSLIEDGIHVEAVVGTARNKNLTSTNQTPVSDETVPGRADGHRSGDIGTSGASLGVAVTKAQDKEVTTTTEAFVLSRETLADELGVQISLTTGDHLASTANSSSFLLCQKRTEVGAGSKQQVSKTFSPSISGLDQHQLSSDELGTNLVVLLGSADVVKAVGAEMSSSHNVPNTSREDFQKVSVSATADEVGQVESLERGLPTSNGSSSSEKLASMDNKEITSSSVDETNPANYLSSNGTDVIAQADDGQSVFVNHADDAITSNVAAPSPATLTSEKRSEDNTPVSVDAGEKLIATECENEPSAAATSDDTKEGLHRDQADAIKAVDTETAESTDLSNAIESHAVSTIADEFRRADAQVQKIPVPNGSISKKDREIVPALVVEELMSSDRAESTPAPSISKHFAANGSDDSNLGLGLGQNNAITSSTDESNSMVVVSEKIHVSGEVNPIETPIETLERTLSTPAVSTDITNAHLLPTLDAENLNTSQVAESQLASTLRCAVPHVPVDAGESPMTTAPLLHERIATTTRDDIDQGAFQGAEPSSVTDASNHISETVENLDDGIRQLEKQEEELLTSIESTSIKDPQLLKLLDAENATSSLVAESIQAMPMSIDSMDVVAPVTMSENEKIPAKMSEDNCISAATTEGKDETTLGLLLSPSDDAVKAVEAERLSSTDASQNSSVLFEKPTGVTYADKVRQGLSSSNNSRNVKDARLLPSRGVKSTTAPKITMSFQVAPTFNKRRNIVAPVPSKKIEENVPLTETVYGLIAAASIKGRADLITPSSNEMQGKAGDTVSVNRANSKRSDGPVAPVVDKGEIAITEPVANASTKKKKKKKRSVKSAAAMNGEQKPVDEKNFAITTSAVEKRDTIKPPVVIIKQPGKRKGVDRVKKPVANNSRRVPSSLVDEIEGQLSLSTESQRRTFVFEIEGQLSLSTESQRRTLEAVAFMSVLLGLTLSVLANAACISIKFVPINTEQQSVMRMGLFTYYDDVSTGWCVAYPSSVQFDMNWIAAKVLATLAMTLGMASAVLWMFKIVTGSPCDERFWSFSGVLCLLCFSLQGSTFLLFTVGSACTTNPATLTAGLDTMDVVVSADYPNHCEWDMGSILNGMSIMLWWAAGVASLLLLPPSSGHVKQS